MTSGKIDCKDLIASWIAYGINADGGIENYPAAATLGFIDPVRCFEAGKDDIDACYVGETADEIILAFRGTAIPIDGLDAQIADWINNFQAGPIRMPEFPGRVHGGFYESITNLATLERNFITEIRERKRAHPTKPLLVTGYSKGAALAPLAAVLLRSAGIPVERPVMFEPPRCGDSAFARQFNAWFPQGIRYEYQDDLVPHLPPRQPFMKAIASIPRIGPRLEQRFDIDDWDYCPVGKLHFVNWRNEVLAIDEMSFVELLGWETFRTCHLVFLLATGQGREVAYDHLPFNGLWDVACSGPCPWTLAFLLQRNPEVVAAPAGGIWPLAAQGKFDPE